MRSQEKIIQQCESRFKEIEQEAEKPERLYPCKTCKFGSGSGTHQKCHEPLIVGFKEDGYVWAWDCKDGSHLSARLCGPEKALWQPREQKKSLFKDIVIWFWVPVATVMILYSLSLFVK